MPEGDEAQSFVTQEQLDAVTQQILSAIQGTQTPTVPPQVPQEFGALDVLSLSDPLAMLGFVSQHSGTPVLAIIAYFVFMKWSKIKAVFKAGDEITTVNGSGVTRFTEIEQKSELISKRIELLEEINYKLDKLLRKRR